MGDDTNKLIAVVLESVNSLRNDLKDHISAEDSELKEIRKSADERSNKADLRHTELLEALNKINIVDALPKTSEGKPDIHGHRSDHELSRRRWDGLKSWVISLLKDGSKYLLGGLALWVLFNLWQAFVQGLK